MSYPDPNNVEYDVYESKCGTCRSRNRIRVQLAEPAISYHIGTNPMDLSKYNR